MVSTYHPLMLIATLVAAQCSLHATLVAHSSVGRWVELVSELVLPTAVMIIMMMNDDFDFDDYDDDGDIHWEAERNPAIGGDNHHQYDDHDGDKMSDYDHDDDDGDYHCCEH